MLELAAVQATDSLGFKTAFGALRAARLAHQARYRVFDHVSISIFENAGYLAHRPMHHRFLSAEL